MQQEGGLFPDPPRFRQGAELEGVLSLEVLNTLSLSAASFFSLLILIIFLFVHFPSLPS